MSIFDEAGAVNAPDEGGQGAGPVPAPSSLPSVSQGAPGPAVSSAPSTDPRLAAVLAGLQPHPQASGWQAVLQKIAPMLGMALAQHNGSGGSFAQGFQGAQENQQRLQDQESNRQLKLAEILHQQAQEKQAVQREKDLANRQLELAAREKAKEARQKALDENSFLNARVADPNFKKMVLTMANQHPENISGLSLKGLGGEGIPLARLEELGYMGKDDKGQYTFQTRKPPISKTVTDGDQIYQVMLDPETGQEQSRNWLAQKQAKPEKAPPVVHYGEPKEELDKEGNPTGKFYSHNAITNTMELVKPGAGGSMPISTKAPPGAAQTARQKEAGGHLSAGLTKAFALLNDAEKSNLIGPSGGRLGKFLTGMGSTGDEKKDAALGALRDQLTTVKMMYPATMAGSTRAAGSPGMIKRLDDVLNSDHMSAAMIRSVLRNMKDNADEIAKDKAAPDNVDHTFTQDKDGHFIMVP